MTKNDRKLFLNSTKVDLKTRSSLITSGLREWSVFVCRCDTDGQRDTDSLGERGRDIDFQPDSIRAVHHDQAEVGWVIPVISDLRLYVLSHVLSPTVCTWIFFFFTVLAQLLSMILCGCSIFFFTQNAHFPRRELTYANFPTVIYIWPQCLISCKDKIMKCHVTFWAEVTLIKHIIKETPESGVSTAVRMKI